MFLPALSQDSGHNKQRARCALNVWCTTKQGSGRLGERRRVYGYPAAIIKCGFVVQAVITAASGHSHSVRPVEDEYRHGTDMCPC